VTHSLHPTLGNHTSITGVFISAEDKLVIFPTLRFAVIIAGEAEIFSLSQPIDSVDSSCPTRTLEHYYQELK